MTCIHTHCRCANDDSQQGLAVVFEEGSPLQLLRLLLKTS